MIPGALSIWRRRVVARIRKTFPGRSARRGQRGDLRLGGEADCRQGARACQMRPVFRATGATMVHARSPRSNRRVRSMRRSILLFLPILLLVICPVGRARGDEVLFLNGDRLTGKILKAT